MIPGHLKGLTVLASPLIKNGGHQVVGNRRDRSDMNGVSFSTNVCAWSLILLCSIGGDTPQEAQIRGTLWPVY